MKKHLLSVVGVLLIFAISFAQDCQNYSFYLADNHVATDGTRSSKIYNVVLDDATNTANLTEIYTLDKTVHLGFDSENQLLYAVNSATGELFAYDVSINGPEIPIGSLSVEFGHVQVVYHEGALIVANEVNDQIVSYDIASGIETSLGSGPVHGGDLVYTASGDLHMYTRVGGGTIVDMTNGQTVIGSVPSWITGAALMGNGQILASIRFEDEFVVRNADGTEGGTYAARKDGVPFNLANGDLAGGCNDSESSVELVVACESNVPSPSITGESDAENATNCSGFEYGFWSNNLSLGYSASPYWGMTGATFVENLDGTAVFEGLFTNNGDPTLQFDFTVVLSGRTFSTPADSPHPGECEGVSYDTSDWYYYQETNGVLTGLGGMEGAVLNLTRMGPSFQVGTGANVKQADLYGASGWLDVEVISQPNEGSGFTTNIGHCDFNILLNTDPFNEEQPQPCEEICLGESASVTVEGFFGTPPYTFQWSNGDTGATLNVSPTETTVYTVVMTDANGNTAEAAIEITVNVGPSLTAQAFNISCADAFDGSAVATASGGFGAYTYTWGPLTGNQVGTTATGLGAGVYEVMVTDENGCSATDIVVLEIEDSTPPEAICDYEVGIVSFSGTDNCAVVETEAYIQLSCGDQVIVTDGQAVRLECEPVLEGGYTEDGLYMFALAGKDKKYLWRYESNGDDWAEMADAPDKVKEGGALVYAGNNMLYALSGKKKDYFWKYDIVSDSWSEMADAPDKVGSGGALTYDGGNYIYAFRGDKKKEFWRYDIGADSWTELQDAPANTKGGAALAHDGGNYIYAFQGDKKDSFWRYDIGADSWSSMEDAPDKVKDGGALTYDGGNYVYALRGDKKKDFWRYDIAADDWAEMDDAPGDVKYGGALAHDGGNYIYATKGDDKKDFWTYDIATDSWSDNTDAPDKIKYGGALAYVGQVSLPEEEEECDYAYDEEGVLVIAHGEATLVVTVTDSNGLTSTCEREIECSEPPIPCGECDGQLTQLTLEYLGGEADATIKIYEGSVNPDKLFETFTGINAGDQMSFVGSKNDNKMGAKIFLTVNDGQGFEIHTSCSQEIYAGQTWGQYLIVSGISHEGGPLCEGDTPPEGECGECDGQLTQLTLEYLGGEANATIRVYEGSVSPNKLFETFTGINTGDQMSFVGSKNDNKMGAKIFLTVNDGPGLEIHTSCSQEIYAGQTWGDYLIVSGISHDGGPLCPGEDPPGDPEGECGECDGQLTQLTLEYLGGETDATIKIYEGKVKSDKLFETFTGISTGDQMSFVGSKNDNKMGAKIFLTVNDGPGLEIHTSCSQEIYAGQTWGDYLIVSGISHDGGPLCPGENPPGEPEGECGECDGQLTQLTLEYLGGESDATIEIYEGKVKDDKLFATFENINPGDQFSFVGSKNDNKMGAKIFLSVNGGPGFEIHTSCSQEIYVGQTWGNYLIVAGTSHEGGPLCSVLIPELVFEGNGATEAISFEDELSGNLKSQPNPTTGDVVITYTPVATERTQIDIYNTSGQLVRSVYSGVIEEGLTYRTFVDLNHLDNGVYLIRVTGEQAVEIERLIIAR